MERGPEAHPADDAIAVVREQAGRRIVAGARLQLGAVRLAGRVRPVATPDAEVRAPAPLRVAALLEQGREIAEALRAQREDLEGRSGSHRSMVAADLPGIVLFRRVRGRVSDQAGIRRRVRGRLRCRVGRGFRRGFRRRIRCRFGGRIRRRCRGRLGRRRRGRGRGRRRRGSGGRRGLGRRAVRLDGRCRPAMRVRSPWSAGRTCRVRRAGDSRLGGIGGRLAGREGDGRSGPGGGRVGLGRALGACRRGATGSRQPAERGQREPRDPEQGHEHDEHPGGRGEARWSPASAGRDTDRPDRGPDRLGGAARRRPRRVDDGGAGADRP